VSVCFSNSLSTLHYIRRRNPCMEANIKKEKTKKKKKEKKKRESVVKGEGQHVYSTEDLTPPLHPTVSDSSTSASIWLRNLLKLTALHSPTIPSFVLPLRKCFFFFLYICTDATKHFK